MKKYTAEQPPIDVPKLERPPRTGVEVAIITCPQQTCRTSTDAAAEAAKTLGWKVRQINANPTPEAFVSAWTDAVEGHPDAIFGLAIFPSELIEAPLAKAKADDIPVVTLASREPLSTIEPKGVSASMANPRQFAADGELMADIVVADSGGDLKVLYVTVPQLDFALNGWTPRMKEICAGCEVQRLDVQAAQIAKGIPAQVVSHLQRNPDVEYAVFGLADITLGVAPALKAAGIDVKIVTRAPQLPNVREIADGDQFAAVADENVAAGWRGIDALARLLNGEQLPECCREPVGVLQIVNKENADPTALPTTPGVPSAFLEAWGKSG